MTDSPYVIVVGYDNWTGPVLDELERAGTSYTVLVRGEEAGQRAQRRTDSLVEGVEASSFRRAKIEDAAAVLVATQNDRLNVLAVLTARAIDPDLPIVTFAGEDKDVSKLETAGANAVINLGTVVGEALADVALTDNDEPALEGLVGGARMEASSGDEIE